MWNCKNLQPPPYCEMKTCLTPSQRKSLQEARTHMRKSKDSIQDHIKLLTTESYIIKRMIYKLSNQFRSDKALQTLRQVNACMKRLEAVNLMKWLSDSLNIISRGLGSREDEVYLAARHVLEYQLIILQGAGALLRQMVQYCLKTYVHVKQHLELGNMIAQNLVMLALTSRLWFVSNSLGLHVCNLYEKLYPCLAVLKPTAVTWNEKLPADLSEWLKEKFENNGLPEHFCADLQSSAAAEKRSGILPSDVEFLEDLGEPVQREQNVEEPASKPEVQVSPTEKKVLSKRKHGIDGEESGIIKKQKVSVGDKHSDINVDTGSKDLAVQGKMKQYKELEISAKGAETVNDGDVVGAETVDDEDAVTVTEVTSKDVVSVKAYLESVLHTCRDVDKIVKEIRLGTLQIQGEGWKLMKSGRKKMLKHVDICRRLMQKKGSPPKLEKVFVNKVIELLSELLVKYLKHETDKKNSSKTVVDTKNYEIKSNEEKSLVCSLDQDSTMEDKCEYETVDIHKDNSAEYVVKRKGKKEKCKTDKKIHVNDAAKVERLEKADERSQTVFKKKSKKRKRKQKRK